ncbi:MAG TPA: Rieske 2Fe-2S domain-containing protein [Acidimicrobiia bacterium]|nr:Rieske 2Fe-2S domain-containing protein [Acidimicrobiia bacterium]
MEVGPASELTPGTVTGAGRYAVGNADRELFALTRRCRHLYADLANGRIDEEGCLVCPWHGSKYDVETGRMVRGPQGVFAKIRGGYLWRFPDLGLDENVSFDHCFPPRLSLGSTVVPQTTRRQGRSPRRRTGLMQQHPPRRSRGSPSAQPPAHNNAQERPNCLAAPALNRQSRTHL